MKNIIVIGISQSGLYDYVSSLEVNYGKENGYGHLGGFFNSFGDVYRKEVAGTETSSLTQASYTEGSHRRTFGLNRQGFIKDYRDYGSPEMSVHNPVKELEKRISLLGSSKGKYIMALTTWDIVNISQNAPHLMNKMKQILGSSELIFVKSNDLEESAASYLIANETGGWVLPKSEGKVRLNKSFSVNTKKLKAFTDELKVLDKVIGDFPGATIVSSPESFAKVGPLATVGSALLPATFGRPEYAQKATSYFQDADKIKAALASLV